MKLIKLNDISDLKHENYEKDVIFHCYWSGTLNEKHVASVKSCYYFNIKNRDNRKIILWTENCHINEYYKEIEKYCEIKYFNLKEQISNTFMENYTLRNINNITYYSDFIRCLLLYKYGGCWFDLDVFFLKSFDTLFYNFEKEICLYNWEHQNYPNNAIFFSLIPQNDKMKRNIEYIDKRNRGWGFQQAQLTFDLDLEMTVLPCEFFDIDWLDSPHGFINFFKNTNDKITLENFRPISYCYHWHNKWNNYVEPQSPFSQLIQNLNDVIKY